MDKTKIVLRLPLIIFHMIVGDINMFDFIFFLSLPILRYSIFSLYYIYLLFTVVYVIIKSIEACAHACFLGFHTNFCNLILTPPEKLLGALLRSSTHRTQTGFFFFFENTCSWNLSLLFNEIPRYLVLGDRLCVCLRRKYDS